MCSMAPWISLKDVRLGGAGQPVAQAQVCASSCPSPRSEDSECLTADSCLSDSFASGCSVDDSTARSCGAAHGHSDVAICRDQSKGIHCAPGGASPFRELLSPEKEATHLRPCAPAAGVPSMSPILPAERACAVNSMVRVAGILAVDSDVLFMGVACLDRVLAATAIPLPLLSTAALGCLWVASKYDAMAAPSALSMLAAVQPSACISAESKRVLVSMEAHVLKVLDFRVVAGPTAKAFLRAAFTHMQHNQELLALAAASATSCATPCTTTTAAAAKTTAAASSSLPCFDRKLYCAASYLTEISLLEEQLVATSPSHIAAAAIASASMLLGHGLTNAQLVELTGYSVAELQLPIKWLLSVHNVLHMGRDLPPARMYESARKYRHPALSCVGLLPSICTPDDPRLSRLQQ